MLPLSPTALARLVRRRSLSIFGQNWVSIVHDPFVFQKPISYTGCAKKYATDFFINELSETGHIE